MKKSLLILLLSTTATVLPAQDVTVDTLEADFERYREKTLTEKIYAHLDRNLYLTGETVWFKLYTVDGTLHRPLDMSKVAYAEVLTSTGTPVLQAKIQLKDGLGNGSFFLPASLATGNYKFRVYTSWMQNFPPEFYFSQVISVINPFLVPDKITTKVSPACRVVFFPEGGNLVSGIESKVAFKVSDPSGKGGTCNGIIENETGEIIASFTPRKFGLGHFRMKPQHGAKYRAVLTDASGSRTIHPFPEAQTSGYTMQLRDSADALFITVQARGVDDDNVYLFAHTRQIMASAQVRPLHNSRAVFLLNKDELADGITQITLFNHSLRPVCERLYFTMPRKELGIGITASQKTFAPRRKVSVSVHTKDNNNAAAPAHLSMAVYRVDSLSSESPMGIYPYLWLDSDLTGSVETPQYYFQQRTPEANALMDDLMLTHGWRRFDWKDVMENEPAIRFLPEVREHIVTAIVTKDGERQRGVFAYLGSPGKIIRAYGAWSNLNGEARFEIKDFFGPRRLILQADIDSTEQYEMTVVDPFSMQYDDGHLPPLIINEQMKEALQSRSIAMQVQDIYYYDEYGTRVEEPVVDSTAFYGKADNTYLLDDYTRFPLMEEVMREYVPGVFVRKRKDGFHFVVVDYVHGGVLPGDPMVLLDGVPVPDVDDLMRVDPLRVKKLEVVKRPYHLGQAVFYGIVSYATYNGDLGGLELDPRSISLDYNGLQLKRIFHKPEYTREQVNYRLPDQRFLLHWEPDITTDAGGRHQLEFYTSDVPGQYIIVVEGLTDTGLSGTSTCSFTVRPADAQ